VSEAPADSHSPYEALVEFLYLTPVGIVKFRADGTIDMANPTAAQLLMPFATDGDMSDIYRVFGSIAPDLRTRVENFVAHSGQICDQLQLDVPNTHRVLTLGVNKIDPGTFMAVIQDITRVIEQESRIRIDQQRFRAIVDNIRDYAIYTVDLEGCLDEWNRSLNRLGGWQPADLEGANVARLFPPSTSGRVAPSTILLDRAGRHGTAEFEGWSLRRDGGSFWGNTIATALPDRDGNALGFVLVTRDLTERKHIEDRLVALATTDPLTGACNRRAGEAKLEEAFRSWQLQGRVFTVLMLDCDHFKNVNDRWGHDTGDAVLVALVRLCRDKLRTADVAIRWGGEEFVLLLPETGREMAIMIAERLRTAIEAADIVTHASGIRITVSIGVAESAGADICPDDIIRRADHAAYSAKHAGRNRVVAE
jgi:diguanylate cyclase (GGDEF)-like protein/PAS domain S-box-containing protein